MSSQGIFDSEELRSTRRYELGFVAATTFFATLQVVAQVTGLNPQLWASILSSWLVAGMHAAAVWRPPAPRAMAGIVLLDCVLISFNHPEVQSLMGPAVPFVIGSGTLRHPYRELWSFRTSFLYYLMISYLANFVLRLREARVVVPTAAVIHCSLVLFAGYRQRYSPYVPGLEEAEWDRPDTFSNYAMECVLLLFGLMVALLTKRASEGWEERVFDLLATQKSQFIQEKVLRCQAEFTLQTVKDAATHATGPVHKTAVASEASVSVPGFSAPSMCSAPACLAGPPAWHAGRGPTSAADGESPGCTVGTDCLPRDGLVWVEGDAAPCALWKLSPGMRVLCYDSVIKASRHAKVLDVREDTECVEWVNVELADGTSMKMTEDHPVQVGGSVKNVVRAADLTAQRDHVMVHTVVTRPVVISKVTRLSEADGAVPQSRVYVTVQQPERHSILVTHADHHLHQQCKFRLMAVGSADLQPRQLRTGNTFLHLVDSQLGVAFRRTRSWPPYFMPEAPAPSPALEASGANDERSMTSGSEAKESTLEATSEEGAHITLPIELPTRQSEGRLTSYQTARSQNLPSVGSVNHWNNTCVPCTFAHRGVCRSGQSCNKCHEEHIKTRGRLRAK